MALQADDQVRGRAAPCMVRALVVRPLSCLLLTVREIPGEITMVRVAPIYSELKTDRKVFHNNDRCHERNRIEPENVRQGTDSRPVCEHCDRLTREGK
jgi:hypothetical protein